MLCTRDGTVSHRHTLNLQTSERLGYKNTSNTEIEPLEGKLTISDIFSSQKTLLMVTALEDRCYSGCGKLGWSKPTTAPLFAFLCYHCHYTDTDILQQRPSSSARYSNLSHQQPSAAGKRFQRSITSLSVMVPLKRTVFSIAHSAVLSQTIRQQLQQQVPAERSLTA